ncbi:hypothetical protein Tco_1395448 [Tanacetum coccineum]
MERAATTASSLEAEQDSGNINRTRSMATLNKSFPQGTSSDSGPRKRELVRIKIDDGNAFWNEIKVNTGDSKLMLLRINLLLLVLVNAARHNLLLLVNEERHIQALVDKKKVIITEKSVISDLMLEDVEGTECLPNDVIFEQLTLMGTMASTIICLATNQKFNFSKYIFDNMMKNLEVGVKFRMYPRFLWENHPSISNYDGSSPEDMGEDLTAPTDSYSTPIITQPSSSKPQNKKSRRKRRKDSGPIEPIPNEATNEEPISTPSCDPPQSAKTTQAKEIASLKKRVKQLEKRRKSRTSRLKRLRKVGSVSRVESSNDVSLGTQEDASKQGRKIADLDDDVEVTLINETQERNDEDLMFDTNVLNGDEVFEDPIVNAAKTTSSFLVSAADPVTTAGEVVTTASATTTVDELTLAQTLIEIKAAKPKAVITAARTITTVVANTRPKAKGIVFHDQEEQAPAFTPIVSSSQTS